MRNKYLELFFIMLIVCFSQPGFSQAYKYTLVDFPDDNADWNWTQFSGINEKGVISGGAFSKDFGEFTAFLYDGKRFNEIKVPGSTWTRIGDISNKEGFVGWFRNPGEEMNHGYFVSHKNADFRYFDAPGALYPFIRDINDRGYMIIESELGYFIYNSRNESYHFVDYPGADQTQLSEINNHNIVSGWYYYQDTDGKELSAGFLYDLKSGQFLDADANEHNITSFGALNERGQVIGFRDANTPIGWEATVYDWKNKTSTLIHFPNAYWTSVQGINNKGILVGEFADANGHHAFIAEPISPK